jgi:hypothetical protein
MKNATNFLYMDERNCLDFSNIMFKDGYVLQKELIKNFTEDGILLTADSLREIEFCLKMIGQI